MLAEYKRQHQPFQETFGVSAIELIKGMDASLADIAKQVPKHRTKLGTVGLQRDDVPVIIADPLDDTLTHQLRCSVRISVSLDAMLRGIHVSRMSNALAEVCFEQCYPNLLAFTTNAADKIAMTQEASSCRVQAEGVYTFRELIEGWKPEKNKTSIEAIPLTADTFYSDSKPVLKSAGFRISHITACPCVQSALVTLMQLKDVESQGVPLLTHSQRCETEITLKDVIQYFDFPAALMLVDRCTTRTQNTLPREQELSLVHRSHSTPSFLEDVVRDCANEFTREFSSILNPGGGVHVSSVSQESIHCFNLHAEATVSCAIDDNQAEADSICI